MLPSLRRTSLAVGRRCARLYSSTEVTIEDEHALTTLRRALKTKSFMQGDNVQLSPELREKVNREFEKFITEFVYEHNFTDELDDIAEDMYANTGSLRDILNAAAVTNVDNSGNMSGYNRFPKLQPSDFDEPYTSQELYIRQLFHAGQVSGMGAHVSDVYRPHEDVYRPPTVDRTSIATLLAAGTHLGHSTNLLRPNCLPYIYGEKDGVHIVDLNQTLAHLRRAAKVVEGIARKGGVVLFVGTRDGQEHSVQVAAKRAGGYYVHTRWVPGTLTNASNISGEWERHEVDMADRPTGRNLDAQLQKRIIKPDLTVILNPVENRNLLHECIAARVPTVGVIDTDSEPSLVTYPIPGNDDSLRSCDLILGVLSNAAKRGREARVAEFAQYKNSNEAARDGADFNATAAAPGALDGLIREEALMAQRP